MAAGATETPKPKHPGGRPSSYDPAYIDQLIDIMSEGYSLTAVAGKLGVCRDTLHAWGSRHPEFADAIKRGHAARTAYLEEGLLSAKLPATITSRIFALKNAAPQEWRDKVESVHSMDGDTLGALLAALDGKSRGLPSKE